ncbi:MAG: hypothetical protein FD170_2615 [Bacteroidetes bacterium]|nr:MAG: hypothetical protein FD170_2615 [Bacteroidota bacterium]
MVSSLFPGSLQTFIISDSHRFVFPGICGFRGDYILIFVNVLKSNVAALAHLSQQVCFPEMNWFSLLSTGISLSYLRSV